MSEYQLIDTFNSTLSLLFTMFSLFITITTAYLVAAYAYGKKLTRTQCIIVSALYLVSSGFFISTVFSAATRASYNAAMLNQVAPDYPVYLSYAASYSLLVMMILGLAASIKFMMDIRKA